MNSDGGEVVLGLLRVAGMDIAVPLSALREVLPCPLALSGLPTRAEGLIGAMQLRSLVLPVLDLRPILGLDRTCTDDAVVVVIAEAGCVLGLLTDEVRDVLRVPADALIPVTTHADRLLFSHAFLNPETGAPVSVLDAAAVFSRPGLPVVADPTRAAAPDDGHGAAAGVAPTERRLVTIRCGNHVLAVDIAHMHTTVPEFVVRQSVLTGPLCRGVIDFAGSEVPVVDPLELLGLGRMANEDFGAGLVFDLGQGHVVLGVTALLDLVELCAHDILGLPALATHRPDLLTGTAKLPDGSICLVLEGAALLTDDVMVSLGSVNTISAAQAVAPPRRDGDRVERQEGAGPPYLIHSAGTDLATPLDQVVEILPCPPTMLDISTDDVVLGVIVHRSMAVLVFSLATIVGREPVARGVGSCLLLVAVDGGHFAFAVDTLHSIEPLTWRDPDATGVAVLHDDRAAVLRSAPLLQLGSESRLLPEIDLRELARSIIGRPQPAPALEPPTAQVA